MRFLRILTLISVLVAAVAAMGCGKKAEQASTASSDSLVSSNPTEQQSGNITPQTAYQEPPKQQAPPPAEKPARPRTSRPPAERQPVVHEAPAITMASGTGISIDVTSAVTSETAQAGDTWTGTVKDNVIVGDRVVIPAGSAVTGTVRGATPAKKGSRAMLLLGVSSVNVNGKDYSVQASTDSIIAGSTRARNLGTIAGGAAAGALIGKAVGGGGKGGLIGGLIGGAVATGAVASTKGYQVAIKPGTTITFKSDAPVAFRP
jgi:hypothetical protein